MEKIDRNRIYYLKDRTLLRTQAPINERSIVDSISNNGVVHGHFLDYEQSHIPGAKIRFLTSDTEFFKIFSEQPINIYKTNVMKYKSINGKNVAVIQRMAFNSATLPCPFCGKPHKHGTKDGHRLTHCGDGEKVKDVITSRDGTKLYREDGYFVETIGLDSIKKEVKKETFVHKQIDLKSLDREHKIAYIINELIDKTKLYIQGHLSDELKEKGCPSPYSVIKKLQKLNLLIVKKIKEEPYRKIKLWGFKNQEPIHYSTFFKNFRSEISSYGKENKLFIKNFERTNDIEIQHKAEKIIEIIQDFIKLQDGYSSFNKSNLKNYLSHRNCPYYWIVPKLLYEKEILIDETKHKSHFRRSVNKDDIQYFTTEIKSEIEYNYLNKNKNRGNSIVQKINPDIDLNNISKEDVRKIISQAYKNDGSNSPVEIVFELEDYTDFEIQEECKKRNIKTPLSEFEPEEIRNQYLEYYEENITEKMEKTSNAINIASNQELVDELRKRGVNVKATQTIEY